MRFLNSTLLAIALASWSVSAHAGPGDATRLEYARSEQAAGCPDQTALQSAVVKHLGYDPFFPAARQTIVVEITGEADGLRARMHLVDEHGMIVGSRELRERPEHCDELVASLALAISIALDPTAAPDSSVNAPKSAEKVEPEPDRPAAPELPAESPAAKPAAASAAPPPTSKPKPKPAPPSSEPGPLAVRAGAFVALGAAPAPAVGVRVGASARWDWFRVVAELADQLPAQKTMDQVGGVRASLLSATVAPCAVHGAFAGCALLAIGSLHAQGLEILDASSEQLLNVMVGLRLEYAPTLIGRLRLLTNVDVDRSLTPFTLRVHSQVVWKTPALSPALGVGLGWQF